MPLTLQVRGVGICDNKAVLESQSRLHTVCMCANRMLPREFAAQSGAAAAATSVLYVREQAGLGPRRLMHLVVQQLRQRLRERRERCGRRLEMRPAA